MNFKLKTKQNKNNLLVLNYLLFEDIMWYMIAVTWYHCDIHKHIMLHLQLPFLPVIILRVPQKKKSSSLEDLQSESLEKVGLFVLKISGVKSLE